MCGVGGATGGGATQQMAMQMGGCGAPSDVPNPKQELQAPGGVGGAAGQAKAGVDGGGGTGAIAGANGLPGGSSDMIAQIQSIASQLQALLASIGGGSLIGGGPEQLPTQSPKDFIGGANGEPVPSKVPDQAGQLPPGGIGGANGDATQEPTQSPKGAIGGANGDATQGTPTQKGKGHGRRRRPHGLHHGHHHGAKGATGGAKGDATQQPTPAKGDDPKVGQTGGANGDATQEPTPSKIDPKVGQTGGANGDATQEPTPAKGDDPKVGQTGGANGDAAQESTPAKVEDPKAEQVGGASGDAAQESTPAKVEDPKVEEPKSEPVVDQSVDTSQTSAPKQTNFDNTAVTLNIEKTNKGVQFTSQGGTTVNFMGTGVLIQRVGVGLDEGIDLGSAPGDFTLSDGTHISWSLNPIGVDHPGYIREFLVDSPGDDNDIYTSLFDGSTNESFATSLNETQLNEFIDLLRQRGATVAAKGDGNTAQQSSDVKTYDPLPAQSSDPSASSDPSSQQSDPNVVVYDPLPAG